jgi:hypothetical protein
MPWGFAALAVGTVAGSVISGNAAESAAQTQAGAAENAQQIQQGEFNQVLGNEAPFVGTGQEANSQLAYLLGVGPNGQSAQGGPGSTGSMQNGASGPGARLGQGPGGATSTAAAPSSTYGGYGSLLTPFNASNFKSMSPAYQFQLQQGAQGTLNQDSGAQGAESGAALKDLQSYNQNFANTSFNNAFQQYQTQQNNVFGRLSSLATLGQGAASNQATGASSFANSIGNSATNVGTALGAGQIGMGNAASSAANNLGQIGAAYAANSGGGFTPDSAFSGANVDPSSIGGP